MHGGPKNHELTRGPNSPTWKDGKYSRVFKKTEAAARYQELVTDPEYSHLHGEIASLRMAREEYLAQWQDQLGEPQVQKPLLALDEQIRKLVDSAHKIEYDEANVVTVATLMAYAARIGVILREEIVDQRALDRASHRIESLFYARVQRPQLVAAEVIDG